MNRNRTFFDGIDTYLRLIKQGRAVPALDSRVSVVLKITNQCQSRCRHCYGWAENPIAAVALDMVRSLCDDLHHFGMKKIVVSGGEPTCHPQFSDITESIAKAGIHQTVITNGLWDCCGADPEWITCADDLVFSIDSADENVYELVRGVRRLNEVLANLQTAITCRQQHGKSPPAVNVVLSKPAIAVLNDTVKCLGGMGVGRFHFLQLETHVGIPTELVPSAAEVVAVTDRILPDLSAQIAAQLPPRWSVPGASATQHDAFLTCVVPWCHAVVRSNGDTYACCRLGDDGPSANRQSSAYLGNIRDTPLSRIWTSNRMAEVRSSVRSGMFNACRNCWLGSICSYDQLLDDAIHADAEHIRI